MSAKAEVGWSGNIYITLNCFVRCIVKVKTFIGFVKVCLLYTSNTSGLNYYYCNYDLKSFSNKLLTDFSATVKTYNILLNWSRIHNRNSTVTINICNWLTVCCKFFKTDNVLPVSYTHLFLFFGSCEECKLWVCTFSRRNALFCCLLYTSRCV